LSEAVGSIRRFTQALIGALREATSGRRYWSTMGGTRNENGQPAPAASGWPAVGTMAAYAAAIAAFGYALVDLYWALGGRALVSTVGGYGWRVSRRGVCAGQGAAGVSW
jgi:hypothetical protein